MVGEGAWGVFFVDVVEDFLAVFGAAEGFEVGAVALPHEVVDGWGVEAGEVGDVEAAAWFEPCVEVTEDELPVVVVSEVMEDCACEDDVEGVVREGEVAEVGVEGLGVGDAGVVEALGGSGEHGEAEVDEGAVERGDFLEDAEGEVASAAAEIEEV